MKTLEELKSERDRLVKMRSKSLKDRIESQKLKEEIRSMKYPQATAALKTIKKGGVAGFRTIGRGVKGVLVEQLKIGAEEKKRQSDVQRKRLQQSIRRQVMKTIKKKKTIKRKKKK